VTPLYVDAQGREHEMIKAEKSVTVPDPALGFDRQIVEGQYVPPELQEAYEDRVSRAKKRSARRKAAAKSESSEQKSDDE
jgi:hypothetical protein